VSADPPVPTPSPVLSRLPPPPRAPRTDSAHRRMFSRKDPRTTTTVPDLRLARADSVPPSTLRKPRISSDYVVGTLVHRGARCDIWTGADAACRPVVIKIAASDDLEVAARITAEARSLALLTHRSIVRAPDHGVTPEGRPYIVLEWLKGETLAQLLSSRAEGLPPREAIRLLLPIASALSLAHDRGIVHGDVRAEHILLVPLGPRAVVPKLIDFGSSRAVRSLEEPMSRSYVAPSPEADPAMDVRGLSATIFHAIMGRPLFAEAAEASLMAGAHRDGLSDNDVVLWRLLAMGLTPDSQHRPRTPRELARELCGWAGLHGLDADITGTPIRPGAGRRDKR